ITIVGVSTSPPSAVSPSVASVAPPPTGAREPGSTEPAEPNSAGSSQVTQANQPIQSNEPGQDGPTSIATGTNHEIPSVTTPTVSGPAKSAASSSAVGTDSLSPSHEQAVDVLHAPPTQHQGHSAETPAALRVEAYIGVWAREPADCRNRADDQRIRI